MTPPDRGLLRARRAYTNARIASGARGVVLAAAIAVLAIALHRMTSVSFLLVGVLAITLAVLGWRGGAWRRGALAGVLAGLPPLVAPGLVFALTHGGHCADCASPTLPCILACFGAGLLVGTFVGGRALRDPSPARFAAGAFATAAIAGLLGCATTGLGGATGVVVGLVAGGLTGWRAMKTLRYPQG